MVEFRNEVSHQWTRRHTLRKFRAGMLSRDSLCDADFVLVTASKFHGSRVPTPCPVCDSDQLRHVLWVYGESLGRASGSACTMEEIVTFAQSGKEFTVHTVEVCPDCRWNHLLNSVTAMPQ
ncbi:hypothetical protein FRC0546_02169 [Corynebacterium diphtheriae]|uniref:DUF5318 family protein n=1 Tax=Corynebacterium diphtheriae TaxID=1717 RepID=UPI0013C8ED7F|nr:DUF5318 family protein [Corynebacterium diphtheriae]QOE68851.1 hypothetical protein FGA20_11080 [Corynebacterium diphtheriae bv. mitis]CAB1048813.1 hypothetical protein FRC0546_02169 [Corynebacterium diphtheriae]